MSDNLLAQLKDIHLPPAIGFWPLAPGWYLVLALVIIAGVALLSWGVVNWKKHQQRKIILHQVDELFNQYQQTKTAAAVTQASVLLKRVALKRYPRHEAAGLHGQSWLKFLNAHCPKKLITKQPFLTDAGQLLITAPYQKKLNRDASKTFELVKMWVKHNV
jgi:hypothetical protein